MKNKDLELNYGKEIDIKAIEKEYKKLIPLIDKIKKVRRKNENK